MEVRKIDKSNMRKVILNFPNQIEEALKFTGNIKVRGNFENIIVCGVGGSALPADILLTHLNLLNSNYPPIYIHRDYGLPRQAGKKSLIICISYSGNTEETISAFKAAIKKNLKIAGISSGGKIAELCRKYKIPLITIPSGIQPRSATGYIFTSLLKLLSNSKIVRGNPKEIKETVKELKKIIVEKEGQKMAKRLVGKIPLIYASNQFKALALAWKIKFNENSKTPAFSNCFPELNHNEMVGFTRKGENFYIIILRDAKENPRILKRMKLIADLIKKIRVEVEFIDIKKGSPLFKIFSNLILGDWVSYYLALEYKIDPTPVKIVEEFKKRMKN